MSEFPRLEPRPAPPRQPAPGPFRIERSDRCMSCGACVRACLYGCHERRDDDPRKMADPLAQCCRNCFACVLYCPRGALSMHPDPDYAELGEGVYTPALIRSNQEQAAAGRVPVSGSGYKGPFDGEGFDNLWTDMSEIVRPTRDGIHGREHISTTILLGRNLDHLCGMEFDAHGHLKTELPPNREVPIPILFGQLPFSPGPEVATAAALAATQLGTYLTVRPEDDPSRLSEYFNHLVVALRPDEVPAQRSVLEWASIVEVEQNGDPLGAISQARGFNPHLLGVVRVKAGPEAPETALALCRGGAEILHLAADYQGRGAGDTTLLQSLRDTHETLVAAGERDRITLLASGGIAAAEHVPKVILTGADMAVVDVPVLLALECTLCGACGRGEPCPLEVGTLDPRWGATRIINLVLAWRDQLLEVLGAMGLRDVRRLRGEVGRALYADRAREDFRVRLGRVTGTAPATRGDEAPAAPRDSAALERGAPPSEAPHRFPMRLGAWRIRVDRERCTDCGLCAESCRFGVHRRHPGKVALEEPVHGRCIGEPCREHDWCCVNVCPWDALTIERDAVDAVLGDRRWTASLLRETWREARHGEAPGRDREQLFGASGGGFDRIQLASRGETSLRSDAEVDLSLSLNRRSFGPRLTLPLPLYGGGMSYGSISLSVMRGRAMAAQALGTFTCTGEGGYPDALIPYADHVITQVATGLFGVREETILRSPLVEFKYAQGAKPGLGGHLLGEKNTPEVSAMREAVPGTSLFSPFPFHSVYSVEDHKKHLDWIRAIHPDVLLSVKVSTPGDVDMVAVGSYYAGANIVFLDGSYGGTGAAPDIAKKNIAQPIEYAVAQAHDFLSSEGIRDKVVLMAGGGVRSPEDLLKAVALGADGVVVGTAELVALDCVRCGNCERDRGCPIGIATTDPELAPQLEPEWVRDRIVGLYLSWAKHLRFRLRSLGLARIRDLRGRRDLLAWIDDPEAAS